jgi:ATP-dependent Lhr-like helicase
LQLARYGILTRGSVLTEAMTPNFFDTYRVMSAMEDQGTTRRGYFVAGLGAAQFALPGAVDRLREATSSGWRLLAACNSITVFPSTLQTALVANELCRVHKEIS